MIQGSFLVIEGIDGSGTTTQCKLLESRFKEAGLPVRMTREPSDGPIGNMLRQALTGRLLVHGATGARALHANTMALLFAADRMDHLDATVLPNLAENVTVISDRYYHSSLAYQSLTSSNPQEAESWILSLNRFAKAPDLTLVIDVSGETAESRRASRKQNQELYEERELQMKLASYYMKLEQHFPNQNIVHIDGEMSVDEISQAIWKEVEKLRHGV